MESQTTVTTPPKPEPPKRLRSFRESVGEPILGLLRLAPLNPSVRALLLAKVKIPIPDDADTYEKVVDWYEFNPDISIGNVGFTHYPTVAPAPVEFTFSVDVTATEIGRCRYTRQLSGSGLFHLTGDEILAITRESDSMSDFYMNLHDKISNIVDMDDVELEPSGDSVMGEDSYYEHEGHGIEDQNWSYQQANVNRSARDFLALHFPNALLRLESVA